MADDVLTRDTDGNLAVRTVSSTGDNYVNKDDVYTRDSDGKLCVRVTGQGGGGDQHNLGYFATQAALEEAHPTAEAGDWAIVGATDTVWIWDTDNLEWVDSDQKGQVTSVNNQTGTVVLTASDVGALPDNTHIPADPVQADWNEADSSALDYIKNKPTIPTVNNATLTITQGGTTKGTFTANAGTDVTIDVDAGGSSLPSQSGNAGKFLTTDGTDASWSDKPLVNSTTWSNALTISGTAANASYGTNVGFSSTTNASGSAFGYDARAGSEGTAIGSGTRSTGWRSVAVGAYADTNYKQSSICIGYKSKINATNALQINLSDSVQTNSDANTVKIANANGNFEIMSADGTIPKERLANVVSTPSTMPTLAVADWSNNTQTVNVTGVTATNTVFVSPAPASAADYASAGIVCTAQGAGTLTFTCTTTPTNAITVNVVCL